ncbi:MAG: APC family permease [Pseudorhodobacter sp.]|nr:APC family permease [Pseudorhodobacter sp.]
MSSSQEKDLRVARPELRRVLSRPHLFVFGLVSMGPIAAFSMYGFVFATSGGAIILAYLIGAMGVMLTALSFAQMASVAPHSGSVYGYANLQWAVRSAFWGGWAILLDYLLLASLTAVYGALYLFSALPQIPQFRYLLGFFALLLISGVRGFTLSTKFDFSVLAAQLGFCAIFILLALLLTGPGSAQSPLTYDFLPKGATVGALLGGASLAVVTFLGFDAISTLAEEVTGEHPGRRIGQATVMSVAAMLALFILISWLLSELAQGLTLPDPSTSAFDILVQRLPALATPLALVCGLALGIGGSQACHTGATRLTFAMARDRCLPGGPARLNAAFHTPMKAMAMTLAVIVATIAIDHVDVLAGLVSFGALTGFLLVNVSVVVHFGIRQRSRAWLAHWLAPLLGVAVVLDIISGINPLALELGLGWMVSGMAIYWFHAGARRALRSRQGLGIAFNPERPVGPTLPPPA